MLKKSFILVLCLLQIFTPSAFALEIVPIQPIFPPLAPIVSIERVQNHAQAFNLTVNPYETFYAGGYLVHNKRAPTQVVNPLGFLGNKPSAISSQLTAWLKAVSCWLLNNNAKANSTQFSSQHSHT